MLFLQSLIESKIEDMPFLKGGHVFWEAVEKKVDALANGSDIPPERKAKIVASIKKKLLTGSGLISTRRLDRLRIIEHFVGGFRRTHASLSR